MPVPERHRGHLRIAKRFVAEHADRLRHVHGIGWFRWDGARWAVDEKRADVEAAVATVKAALGELDRLDGPERTALFMDVRKAESATGIDGMVRIASALPPISTASKRLDADPYLFNTPTSTVNLHTGIVRANDRADLLTKVAGGPLAPEHNAEWQTFLARILPDEDVRSFVQRLFGYAMLGKVTEHVMPIFTGTGANGKAPCATRSCRHSVTTRSKSTRPSSWSPSTSGTARSRCACAARASRSARRPRKAGGSPRPP